MIAANREMNEAATRQSQKSKSRMEVALMRGSSFKNYAMLLAVKAQSLPGSEFYQALTRNELDRILKDGINDSDLRNLPRIFIVPRDTDYSTINDEIVRRLVVAMAQSPSKSGNLQNSVQKSASDYKPSTFNSNRKRASVVKVHQSNAPVFLPSQILGVAGAVFVITDQALQELQRVEQKYFDVKKVYDVLNDEEIFDAKLYSEPEDSKHKRLTENLPHPLIITIRKP